jgi:hypothetical protein
VVPWCHHGGDAAQLAFLKRMRLSKTISEGVQQGICCFRHMPTGNVLQERPDGYPKTTPVAAVAHGFKLARRSSPRHAHHLRALVGTMRAAAGA